MLLIFRSKESKAEKEVISPTGPLAAVKPQNFYLGDTGGSQSLWKVGDSSLLVTFEQHSSAFISASQDHGGNMMRFQVDFSQSCKDMGGSILLCL